VNSHPAGFTDRAEAGRFLAHLVAERVSEAPVVLGLPRGGVPVAAEIATRVAAKLDVLVVRKLGVPGHTELAFGALASGDALVLNDDVVVAYGLTTADMDAVIERERAELARREHAYRGGRPAIDVTGQEVVLVDDGLATGASMRGAVQAVRSRDPRRILVAVPVAAPQSAAELAELVEDIVVAIAPPTFIAVGQWYADFRQTTDDEVREALGRPRG